VQVVAIAARDEAKARAFAAKHGLPRVRRTYQELLEDRDIDAVYVPLPNSFHTVWSARAMTAGKHVLCEKPLVCNANEAETLSTLARQTGRVLAEAMHYRYHPLARRIREIVASGALGAIEHIEGRFSFPVFLSSNIRYNYSLGGGATMDQGCYAVNLIRFVSGEEPRVIDAQARLASPDVDRFMTANFALPTGGTARLTCSIWSLEIFRCSLRVRGTQGELRVTNPVAPQLFHSLKWSVNGEAQREHFGGCESTFFYQLRAFADAVRNGTPIITGAAEAAANMRVIDDIYRAAGLQLRRASKAT
jgi:predicted dehydrogenase